MTRECWTLCASYLMEKCRCSSCCYREMHFSACGMRPCAWLSHNYSGGPPLNLRSCQDDRCLEFYYCFRQSTSANFCSSGHLLDYFDCLLLFLHSVTCKWTHIYPVEDSIDCNSCSFWIMFSTVGTKDPYSCWSNHQALPNPILNSWINCSFSVGARRVPTDSSCCPSTFLLDQVISAWPMIIYLSGWMAKSLFRRWSNSCRWSIRQGEDRHRINSSRSRWHLAVGGLGHFIHRTWRL